jgi:hypothetical protein
MTSPPKPVLTRALRRVGTATAKEPITRSPTTTAAVATPYRKENR